LYIDDRGIKPIGGSRGLDAKSGAVGKALTEGGDISDGIGGDPDLSWCATVVGAKPPERLTVVVGVSAEEFGGGVTANRIAGEVPPLIGADTPAGDTVDSDRVGAGFGGGIRRSRG
jgi:hypothetical protein